MKHALWAIPLALLLCRESDALACGGCFRPPLETQNPTVVTDHRMIFSISSTQSTLYDQIRFSGSPSSFAWVLPFAGDIEVGVSDDAVFATLDTLTQTQIIAPAQTTCTPINCSSSGATSGGFTSGTALPPAVQVLKQEVVGPYETAQLKATDPNALETWLTQHGYDLPQASQDVVTAYQNEHFNFLAVKLVPGQGVQAMRPIRVTTKGANVALPLRMVAAGAGPSVGITLWIVGEGRYEPSNFATFTIAAGELTWDFNSKSSDYLPIRASKTAAANGRAWEIESALAIAGDSIRQRIEYGGTTGPLYPDGGSTAPDYQPSDAGTGPDVEQADLDTLFAGIASNSTHVTRIRADLSHTALDADLIIKASADQTEVPNVRNVTKSVNDTVCPPQTPCPGGFNDVTSDDSGCTTASDKTSPSTWLAIFIGVGGLAFSRRRRKEHSK
jgi:MYXO-CTERM domain-containing protein